MPPFGDGGVRHRGQLADRPERIVGVFAHGGKASGLLSGVARRLNRVAPGPWARGHGKCTPTLHRPFPNRAKPDGHSLPVSRGGNGDRAVATTVLATVTSAIAAGDLTSPRSRSRAACLPLPHPR